MGEFVKPVGRECRGQGEGQRWMGRGFGGRTAFSRLRKSLPIGDGVWIENIHRVVNMGISLSKTWKVPLTPSCEFDPPERVFLQVLFFLKSVST